VPGGPDKDVEGINRGIHRAFNYTDPQRHHRCLALFEACSADRSASRSQWENAQTLVGQLSGGWIVYYQEIHMNDVVQGKYFT
jgi:hypothetical protein